MHAFRTVLADYGANRGYLISTAGFQSGAWQAAQSSNVALVSWEELQRQFFDRWLNVMGNRLAEKADRVFPYLVALIADSKGRYQHWTDERKAEYADLDFKYGMFGDAVSHSAKPKRFKKVFPLIVADPDSNLRDRYGVELRSYREYFDFALPLADKTLVDFQGFFKDEKHQPWEWP